MKDLKGLKIHCDNDEEKRELLEEATKQGFRWNSGKKLLELEDAIKHNNYRFWKNNDVTYDFLDQKDYISFKEYKTMSGFTKADLKPCMVVEMEFKNKLILAMICTNSRDELCVSGEGFWCPLYEFGDDLIYAKSIIKKVYGFCSSNRDAWAVSKNGRNLLWERKEETEISVSDAEEELSKLSGKKYKIVKE